MADTDIGSSEPDDAGFDSSSSSTSPLPAEKPPIPAPTPKTSAPKTSLEEAASNLVASSLLDKGEVLGNKDRGYHPYGDGKHGETGFDTLKRLGAGMQYGEKPFMDTYKDQ